MSLRGRDLCMLIQSPCESLREFIHCMNLIFYLNHQALQGLSAASLGELVHTLNKKAVLCVENVYHCSFPGLASLTIQS